MSRTWRCGSRAPANMNRAAAADDRFCRAPHWETLLATADHPAYLGNVLRRRNNASVSGAARR